MKKIIMNNIRFIKYITKFCPKQMPIIFIRSILKSIQSIMGVLLLKYIVDSIDVYQSFPRLLITVMCFLIVNIFLAAIVTWIEQKVNRVNFEIISKKLQLLLFEKSASLDLSCYENTSYYNKLAIAREQAETRIIEVLNSISSIVSSLFSISALIMLITSIEPIIILISLFNVLLSFLLNTLAVKNNHNFYKEQIPVEREMDYVQRVSSLPEYAKELRIYDRFPNLLKNRFNNGLAKMITLIKGYSKRYVKIVCLQNVSSQTLNAITILYLANKVLIKAISIGDFIALSNSTQQLTAQITSFIRVIPELYEHGIYIESFLEYINYDPKIKDGNQYIKPFENANIEFKNVCFKYSDTNIEVLKNINLTIKSGEKIALVGRNGSGKSTIVKLLTRLYDPTEGIIYLQGLPYEDYKVDEIRNYFGTLFQDFQIFSISLMENILMHEIDVETEDIKKVKEALEFSGLSKKVSTLKDGIFTEISREFDNEGAIFSGGESQSIAIARVFLKNSKAIILDEPSSSLDPISERELFNKMMELTTDKTVIFVSHRLSNITHVDKIFYVEDGEIKETGTHYELMQKDGLYAKMYKTQADKYMVDYGI